MILDDSRYTIPVTRASGPLTSNSNATRPMTAAPYTPRRSGPLRRPPQQRPDTPGDHRPYTKVPTRPLHTSAEAYARLHQGYYFGERTIEMFCTITHPSGCQDIITVAARPGIGGYITCRGEAHASESIAPLWAYMDGRWPGAKHTAWQFMEFGAFDIEVWSAASLIQASMQVGGLG